MKKALITILLIITLSAGIFFSADNFTVSAAEPNEILSISVSDRRVIFPTLYEGYEYVHIEYTYFMDDKLVSRIKNIPVSNQAISIEGYTLYQFYLPTEAISFKILRGIDGTITNEFTGDTIHLESESSSFDNVELRIKQIVINEDLITREYVYSQLGASYNFNIHFNLEDNDGNRIPIDRIVRVSYAFDVVKTELWGLITQRTPEQVTIEETTYQPLQLYPYFDFPRVRANIEESDENGFDWTVDLGTYSAAGKLGSIKLDQTQMLTIEYFYEGEFFEEDDVVDIPYDQEDIVDVNPDWVDSIKDWIAKLNNTFMMVVIGLGAILVMLVLMFITKLFTVVKFIFTVIYKVLYYSLLLIKFIMVDIPRYIIKFIIFMIVPADKRKEQTHVGRYL
jgi:hypothetical protein